MATVIERRRGDGCGRPARRSAADIEGDRPRRRADAGDRSAAIKQAWGDHLVLRFRGQSLSDDDLMRFSRQFGELDWAPVAGRGATIAPGRPRIHHGRLERRRERPARSASSAPTRRSGTPTCRMSPSRRWPRRCIRSRCRRRAAIPASATCIWRYETLPAELRRAIEGQICRHDASRNSAGELRRGFVDAPDASADGRRRASDRPHPPGDRPQGAVSRPPAQRLYPGPVARRQRGAARRAVGARDARTNSPGISNGGSAI